MVDNISRVSNSYMGYKISNNQKGESNEGIKETDWTTNAADAVSKAFQNMDDINSLFQTE